MQNGKFTQYGHHIFQLLYQHAFKTNSSDILFHSSSIAVFSKPIFGWEVAFVLFF